MKKIIIGTMLLLIATDTFSQQNKPRSLTKQEYLKKSKHQKSAATLLVSTGVLCTGLGIWGGALNPDSDGHNSGGIFFLVTGITAIGGSIPLFIASGRNKRKGMSLSFKNETTPQIQKSSFVYQSIPSLNLKISL